MRDRQEVARHYLLGVGDEDPAEADVTPGLATGGGEAPGHPQGVGQAAVRVQAGASVHYSNMSSGLGSTQCPYLD